MQADRGARLPGAHLNQVAHLVDHPQPVTGLIGGPASLARQRVGDPPAVLHLTEDLLLGVPDLEHAVP